MRVRTIHLVLALILAASSGAVAQSSKQATVDAAALAIDAPPVQGRGAYINQIGSGNRAVVTQSAPRARAELIQRGDDQDAKVTQGGTGTGTVTLLQSGTANRADLAQAGVGSSLLVAAQSGAGNALSVSQLTTGALYNGAVIAQNGSDNRLTLAQSDEDNRVSLAQDGNGNAMTAVQTGSGNRLAWVQQGNGLSDLRIAQDGGQSISVTQTGGR